MSTTQAALAHKAREFWVTSSQFHPHGNAEVLKEVADRVEVVVQKSGAGRPLVLLDLDSTLYEVGHRTLQILREWTQSPDAREFPKVRERLQQATLGQIGYSVKDTFSAVGLSPAEPEVHAARDRVKAFWQTRFFTNEYLKYDQPYPGAARFAQNLHALGAELIYLTGRDEPGMGDGTRANLVRDGFPWERERTHLLLKPTFAEDDLTHKQKAADTIRRLGTLVASFENEPLNLIALYDLFPQAMHVFVETICSDREAAPGMGLYRISAFEQ